MNSINLVDGFQANIQLKNKQGAIIWQKPFASKDEFSEFIKQNGHSKNGWSLLRGTVIPLRTESLKHFTKDLFLPTFVNFSLKINNLALRVIASTFAVALDMITLPVRLLTTPYRIHYNCQNPEAEHPLVKLINQDQRQKQIEEDVLSLCYETHDVQINAPVEEMGDSYQTAKGHTVKGTIQVALKRIPGGIKTQSSENEEFASYLRCKGDWVVQGFASYSSSIYTFAC